MRMPATDAGCRMPAADAGCRMRRRMRRMPDAGCGDACAGHAARADLVRAMLKLIAVGVALLAACGDNLAGISLDDLAAASRDARCAHAVTCGEVADVATCRTTSLGNPGHISATLRAAIEDGIVTFNAADAEACNEALASRSCDVTSQSSRVEPAACATVFVGTRDAGGACASNAECLSQVCDVPVCTTACCTGLCVGSTPAAHAALGASCEATPCDDTAYCDEALTCVARKGVGDACIQPTECQFGLDCGVDGACAALPAPGQPCDGACRDEGTTCSPTTQTCVPVVLAGAPCEMTSDCSVYYVCDQTLRCSPGLVLGEPCTVGQRCAAPGAFCDAPAGESLGSCALPKQLGAPCTSDLACESQTCDRVTQVCVAEPVCI
jgi:hypothetical protein